MIKVYLHVRHFRRKNAGVRETEDHPVSLYAEWKMLIKIVDLLSL
jgi:hypothetical protein